MDHSRYHELSSDDLENVSGGLQQDSGVQVFSYCVQTGDTLSALATRYQTTVEDILKYNKWISDQNKIEAGSILLIPYTGH